MCAEISIVFNSAGEERGPGISYKSQFDTRCLSHHKWRQGRGGRKCRDSFRHRRSNIWYGASSLHSGAAEVDFGEDYLLFVSRRNPRPHTPFCGISISTVSARCHCWMDTAQALHASRYVTWLGRGMTSPYYGAGDTPGQREWHETGYTLLILDPILLFRTNESVIWSWNSFRCGLPGPKYHMTFGSDPSFFLDSKWPVLSKGLGKISAESLTTDHCFSAV